MPLWAEYQQQAIDEFFHDSIDVDEAECLRHTVNIILPQLLHVEQLKIATVKPSEFQGSLSYTCTVLLGNQPGYVIQYRAKEQNLDIIQFAHGIYGSSVPGVRAWGRLKGLSVYTSIFGKGIPCIRILMDSSHSPTEPSHMNTVTGIAKYLVGAPRTGPQSDYNSPHWTKDVSGASPKLQMLLEQCASTIQKRQAEEGNLPTVLSHSDLSPFNYLVDGKSGDVLTVLDWDDATFDTLGRNFHFVDSLFGYMTPSGWTDHENRGVLERTFYDTILKRLAAQGFGNISRSQLELQKSVGALSHWVQFLKRSPAAERYLEHYTSQCINNWDSCLKTSNISDGNREGP